MAPHKSCAALLGQGQKTGLVNLDDRLGFQVLDKGIPCQIGLFTLRQLLRAHFHFVERVHLCQLAFGQAKHGKSFQQSLWFANISDLHFFQHSLTTFGQHAVVQVAHITPLQSGSLR